MELEPSNPAVEIRSFEDRRMKIPEPLPVRLVAVNDVSLPAPAGAETKLDAFYVGLLKFERTGDPYALSYRADNYELHFDPRERPVEHDSLRPTQIQIPSLGEMERVLTEAQIPYTRQRGITPGAERLVLLDPAGNWIELSEIRLIF